MWHRIRSLKKMFWNIHITSIIDTPKLEMTQMPKSRTGELNVVGIKYYTVINCKKDDSHKHNVDWKYLVAKCISSTIPLQRVGKTGKTSIQVWVSGAQLWLLPWGWWRLGWCEENLGSWSILSLYLGGDFAGIFTSWKFIKL